MAIIGFTQTEDRARALAAELGGTFYDDNSRQWGSPVFRYRWAIGVVVALRERNMHDDSDFFATYYDAKTDSFVETEYASTRGWTYPAGASVDASDEIMAKWMAHNEAIAERMYQEGCAREAKRVEQGKTVKVVRGRKIPKGITGTCIWFGNGSFGERVGIRDADGLVYWTAASNVEVVLLSA